MELVYLWVENYKNIHQQGFNFSGRYRCDYDSDTNELTIDENKDYVHVFHHNINVTAIVGKNGSGKTSLIELITYFRTERFKGFVNSSSIAVFIKKETFYVILPETNFLHSFFMSKAKIINLTKLKLSKKKSIDLDTDLTFFSNIKYDFTEQSSNHQNYQSGHFEDFYQGGKYYKNNDFDDFNSKFVKLIQNNNNYFSFLDADYIFDSFVIEFHRKDFLEFFNKNEPYYEKLISLREKLGYDLLRFNGMTFSELREEKQNNENIAKLRVQAIILSTSISYCINEIINAIDHYRRELKVDELIDDFIKSFDFLPKIEKQTETIDFYSLCNAVFLKCRAIISTKIKEYQILFLSLSKEHDDIAYLSHEFEKRLSDVVFFLSNETIIEELFSSFYPIKNEKHYCQTKILKINADEANTSLIKLFNNIFYSSFYRQDILKINFMHSTHNYNFSHLSNGEKIRLTTFTSISHKFVNLYTSQESSIVMFDEIEQSLHPAWQRRFLSDLFSCFRQIESIYGIKHKHLHFIFASHSPFMLSDIPSQNIIFLDRDENGNCKVVDGLKDKKQTFGANIHTLLSDAFFMKDGLIGEFAKKTINQAISYLNKKQLSADELTYCEDIILIIGEPILKQQLQKMLDSKRLSEIEYIKKQIEELQKKLSEHQHA